MNYLGIDWGQAKIGLATGSDETNVASGFKLLKYKELQALVKELKQIIEQEQIDVVVIGKPVSLSGQAPANVKFDQFIRQMELLAIRIELVDERLTTKQAQKLIRTSGQRASDDVIAAMLILQAYFDDEKLETRI